MSERNDSIALKYRPQTIDQVYGQEDIKQKFRGMLKSKKAPTAILLVGPVGTGKTTIARLIAKCINCNDQTLCKKCPNNNLSKDVVERNMADSRGIDDIRQLVKSAGFKPSYGKYRVFILDEVHQVTSQGQQALLKPLEEPSPNTIWVLCTSEPSKFSRAIVSRCIKWDLKPIDQDAIKKLVYKILSKETDLEDKQNKKLATSIANTSDGYVRETLKIVEDALYTLQIGGIKDVKLALKEVEAQKQTAIDFLINVYGYKLSEGKEKNKLLAEMISMTDGIENYVEFSTALLQMNSYFMKYCSALYLKREKPKGWPMLWNFTNKMEKEFDRMPMKIICVVHSHLTNYKKTIGEFLVPSDWATVQFLAEL